MTRRNDFPILKKAGLIYFDNAATSLKPKSVIEAESDYYLNYGTSVHRGLSPLAEQTTGLYEGSRKKAADFIKAQTKEIIFTSGATMSINLVAKTWGEKNLKTGDIVVLSLAEHHANIVPWLQLKEKIGIEILYIPVLEDGSLDMFEAYRILSVNRVKFLAISHASNVLGIIFAVKELIAFAKEKNIITLVDAAASAAHLAIDVKDLDCDFLVFSAHKIFGPTGVGILYGRQSILEDMPPFLGGGAMINNVSLNNFIATDSPAKFEAGTPNISGVIALSAAIDFIEDLTWLEINSQESELIKYFLAEIKNLNFVRVLGDNENRLPIFSLVLSGMHPHDAADLLGQQGIILRAGHHCAQPLHDYFKINSTLRVSLSFYNNKEEIDTFIKALRELHRDFN